MTKTQTYTYLLPMPGTGELSLAGPFPLNPYQWEYLIDLLLIMRPGLVRDGQVVTSPVWDAWLEVLAAES